LTLAGDTGRIGTNGAMKCSMIRLVSTTIGSGKLKPTTDRATTLPGIYVVVILPHGPSGGLALPIVRDERLNLETFRDEPKEGLLRVT
jgi:hypothetical protein